MFEGKCNSIIFDKSNYENELQMYTEIMSQLRILIKQGYICVIGAQNSKLMRIEYANTSEHMGEAIPIWVFPEEKETIEQIENMTEVQFLEARLNQLKGQLNPPVNRPKVKKKPDDDDGGNKGDA